VEAGHFKPLAGEARRAMRKRLGMELGAWAVFCGWNWRRKGLDMVLEALSRTHDVSLAVVGEDPLEGAAFRTEVQRRGLAARVLFVGKQADPLPWFQAADVFVFPTRYEPFGMVVSEAMACGLPVLVPQGAGAAEVVRNGRGLQILASAEDSATLAKGLQVLVDAPAKAKALGLANRKAVLHLDWDRHVRLLEKLYRTLAAHPPL
jgi:glycosyltransferase involved in cell wall biosynthesis